MPEDENNKPAETAADDARFIYVIWIVAFGVALGLVGSLLENVQINPMAKIFFSGPFVIFFITLCKGIFRRKFCVTQMYIVASLIAIFTNYLGPPGPLKPLFILAGFSFDLGTRFRTRDLTMLDLCVGHLLSAIVGFALSFLMLALLSWELAKGFTTVFIVVGGIYLVMVIPVTWLTWRTITAKPTPQIIKQIRAMISATPINMEDDDAV